MAQGQAYAAHPPEPVMRILLSEKENYEIENLSRGLRVCSGCMSVCRRRGSKWKAGTLQGFHTRTRDSYTSDLSRNNREWELYGNCHPCRSTLIHLSRYDKYPGWHRNRGRSIDRRQWRQYLYDNCR